MKRIVFSLTLLGSMNLMAGHIKTFNNYDSQI